MTEHWMQSIMGKSQAQKKLTNTKEKHTFKWLVLWSTSYDQFYMNQDTIFVCEGYTKDRW